jgi:hypothetical protein
VLRIQIRNFWPDPNLNQNPIKCSDSDVRVEPDTILNKKKNIVKNRITNTCR